MSNQTKKPVGVNRENFANPICLIAGIPFANKKMQMRATASTEAQAAMKNTPCMTFSVHAFDFIL